jgi:hypothetical protein
VKYYLWCKFCVVTEHDVVVSQLETAGVLLGIRWAYRSAVARTLEDHSDAAGYNATSLGTNRFTLFRDRLDRVFAGGKYRLPDGTDAGISLDVLHAELSDADIGTMPRLTPGTVREANLKGSPGWAWHDWRWLLASCAFGKIDDLPWSRKSPTKQDVARQPNPDPDQRSLFEDAAEGEISGLEALAATPQLNLALDTFIIAHSLDPVSRDVQLVFGRPQFNHGGGTAWHWREDLFRTPPTEGQWRFDAGPTPIRPDLVPDAPVRLRRRATEQSDPQASDGQ